MKARRPKKSRANLGLGRGSSLTRVRTHEVQKRSLASHVDRLGQARTSGTTRTPQAALSSSSVGGSRQQKTVHPNVAPGGKKTCVPISYPNKFRRDGVRKEKKSRAHKNSGSWPCGVTKRLSDSRALVRIDRGLKESQFLLLTSPSVA